MRYSQSSLPNILLILAGILLIAGSFFGVLWMGTRAARTVEAVVAVHDIPPMHVIGPGDVALRQVPAQVADAEGGYAARIPVVLGRLAVFGVPAGAVVHPDDVAPASAGSSLDVALTQLSRQYGVALQAVPLALNQAQGFSLPAPGDLVTVYATLTAAPQGGPSGAPGSGQGEPEVVPVLWRVPVLAVFGAGGSGPSVPFSGGSSASTAPGATSGVLVLALTATEAQKLALAEQAGSITLVLDQVQCPPVGCGLEPPGMQEKALLEAAQHPQQPPLPPVAGNLPAPSGQR